MDNKELVERLSEKLGRSKADINKLIGDLKGELMDNSFLSKMFHDEQEKQDKDQKDPEK